MARNMRRVGDVVRYLLVDEAEVEALPREVKLHLRLPPQDRRLCTEKLFAMALLVGGAKRVELGAGGWCDRPLDADGLLLCEHSIHVYPPLPGGPVDELVQRSLLWRMLGFLGIRFSGGTNDEYSQASWLPQKNAFNVWDKMSLPLVVLYFQKLKELADKKGEIPAFDVITYMHSIDWRVG